ncbi:MAG: leucyl aminopeptidase [Nitrospinales bacterium]
MAEGIYIECGLAFFLSFFILYTFCLSKKPMIKTTIQFENAIDHKTECLVLFCREEKKPSGVLQSMNLLLKGAIAESFRDKRFQGKHNQTLLLNSRGLLKTDHVLLAGVGQLKELSEEKLRQVAGTAARLAETSRFKTVSFAMPDEKLRKKLAAKSESTYDLSAAALAEGIYLSLYHFDHYKKPEEDGQPARIRQIILLSSGAEKLAPMQKAIQRARKLAQAVWTARDLALHPSNTATPGFLANTAREMGRKHGFACKTLGLGEMKKLGMGAFLGVARGTDEPPKFIIMEYFGAAKKQPPVVIVGKGVTFDTGGISLKPPANMDAMKMDMSGGAVTIATLQAAASLKLPVNVVGLVPATDNMPSGSAIKPGDVLRSMSGKTIEVLNTDAEGRLILADALTYAARYNPKVIIDIATLTGAVVVALGHQAAGLIGNNSQLTEKLKQSGAVTGERVWELPLWEEYEKTIKSDIADLKNIASAGVGAGTITGAAFLKAFAGDQPWAHLDIAGVSWSSESKPYIPKGASGFGVRLLLNYLENH